VRFPRLPFLALAAAALLLCACAGVQPISVASTVNSDIAAVSQGLLVAVNAACADAAPIATAASVAAASDAKVASLVAYEQSVCGTTGQVASPSKVDATTAAWVGAIKTGLVVAANLPVDTPVTSAK
jgi:hypothetical protein